MVPHRTSEQIAADNDLDAAIRRVCVSRDHLRAGEHIIAWVVVAAIDNAGEPGRDAYVVLHPNGYQPTHSALGLLSIGQDMVADEWVRASDDDD